MIRIGIDIGGTFTDAVIYDEDTQLARRYKTSTTPEAPEEGFLAAIAAQDVAWGEVGSLIHGTTLVANLVVEHRGAVVGLLATSGFRDVLEIQRSYRRELYNLQWEKPRSIVSRDMIVELAERVAADGSVLLPLDEDEVRRAVSVLADRGAEAIACSLFNAYANPVHETVVGRILHEMYPEMPVSLSSEVDGRIREYDRVSTTVVNAYAMPRTHHYIEQLDQAMAGRSEVLYMHSGGGLIPSRTARQFPVTLVNSGPAGGALAGSFLSTALGLESVCTMDMGGTSCDVSLIQGGKPDTTEVVEVAWGVPARVQSIAINVIGAGGGSIASIDPGGALRVGPQSAGAQPGPACYSRGGAEPTVTDANLVLGILSPTGLLGGRLPLDGGAAEAALEGISSRFGIDAQAAAMGVYRIVNANMAEAVRDVTVRVGVDPRDFVLIPFGGAGGQHAAAVAREIGIRSVLFPRNASVLSAFGMLTADLKSSVARTVMMPVAQLDPDVLQREFDILERRALELLEGRPEAVRSISIDRFAEMRYVGQSHEVVVPVPSLAPDIGAEMYDRFEAFHSRRYGVTLGDPAEVVNLAVTVTGRVPGMALPRFRPEAASVEPTGWRRTAFEPEPLPIYWRDSLPPGFEHEGPCLVEETDSVIFIPSGSVVVDEYGNLRLTVDS